MFTSIIDSVSATMSITTALLCTLVSLVLGIIIALVYKLEGIFSSSFLITLAIMPVMVQMVITLVNGQLGTAVAVAGAFGFIRFRSAAGTSREIAGMFSVMVVGLATGMGYITYAAIFTVIICAVTFLLVRVGFGESHTNKRSLKVTIPENLDYVGLFDDLLKMYTKKYTLEQVKTSNLGSLFELSYLLELRREQDEKLFIDEIRTRNGNLPVVCGRPRSEKNEF